LALIGLYEPAAFEGINLEDQNLSGVDFGEFFPLSLNNANLRRANIMNAYFAVTVNGANLSEADIRGTYFDTTGAIVTNLIGTDGHIAGLDLGPGHVLPVRNSFKINSYFIPITIDQHMTMTAGGTLKTVLDADAWLSTISFAPGIPVTRGGTLELTFAGGTN